MLSVSLNKTFPFFLVQKICNKVWFVFVTNWVRFDQKWVHFGLGTNLVGYVLVCTHVTFSANGNALDFKMAALMCVFCEQFYGDLMKNV